MINDHLFLNLISAVIAISDHFASGSNIRQCGRKTNAHPRKCWRCRPGRAAPGRPGGARSVPRTLSGASRMSATDDPGAARPGLRRQAHRAARRILTPPSACRLRDFPARCSARHAAPLPPRGAPDPEASSAGPIARLAQIAPSSFPETAASPRKPPLAPATRILHATNTLNLTDLRHTAAHACRPRPHEGSSRRQDD